MEYLEHLKVLVAPESAYQDWILDILWSIKYVVVLPRDQNRLEDGKKLREKLGGYTENDISVLEVLIALSQRCDSMMDSEENWFWVFLKNMELLVPGLSEEEIRDKIDIWVLRKFSRDGKGSPFPRQKCLRDQRKIELWKQMCGYFSDIYKGGMLLDGE